MDYAYLDKYGILHIAGLEAAMEHAKDGVYTATDVPNQGGYPIVELPGGRTSTIVVYSYHEAYVDGNKTEGKRVKLEDYPEVKALYVILLK